MPWPLFPVCPSFGFRKRADYSASVVERSSGIRTVNRNWYYPLTTFSAVPVASNERDISRLQIFWNAIGGMSGQFLFIDYTDPSSAAYPQAQVTNSDQVLIEIGDTSGELWQLMKLYEDEEFLYQQYRIIQKPVPGSLLITSGGTPLTEGVGYTVDYDTGVVAFTFPATNPTWGGRFYVPVMFDSTPEFMISNRQFQETGFALRELRLEIPELVFTT